MELLFDKKKSLKDGDIEKTLQQMGWKPLNHQELSDLKRCLERYEINTRLRYRHFISQCSHESGLGKWTKECANGKAYEGRKDLGNCHTGDGERFKGSGYIQLTGRANYEAFAKEMKDNRILEGVEYVAKKYPWTSAGFWWSYNQMNELVDRGATVEAVTLRVNGGLRGLQQRKMLYQKCHF